MKRTRVKICGITRMEDAISAIDSGADAIGLVFYEKSPRYINLDKAAEITKNLPPFVSKVALFVDATSAEIKQVLESVVIDVLQFHGDESPQQCRAYGRPYIKAVRMRDDVNLHQVCNDYSDASAILIDSYIEGMHGGTGQIFDWSRIPDDLSKKIILAGGLSVENVAAAVAEVSPYAVDVSGGVEIEKGIKDAALIEKFMNEVLHAK